MDLASVLLGTHSASIPTADVDRGQLIGILLTGRVSQVAHLDQDALLDLSVSSELP